MNLVKTMENKTNEETQALDIINCLNGDSEKLVTQFGASRMNTLTETPDHPFFKNGLLYSHRDFDKFYTRLMNGEKSAIVSGLNPSSVNFHIGHMAVMEMNLFLQKKYGLDIFIPLSDDESYVAMKIKDQEEGLKNALLIAKSIIAYGFDPAKTHVVIDQVYTNIYNLAFKVARGINMSTINATYNYQNENSTGLFFYPAVQAAHILLPEVLGMRNVIVPISADEDSHIRISRDVAEKYGFDKCAVLHSRFLPGLDGKKMSKSKGNGIFLHETEKEIRKKINQSFSGGRKTIEEHKKYGGIPEADVAYNYLKYYFLRLEEADQLYNEYKAGKILSGEMKKMFADKLVPFVTKFQERYNNVTAEQIAKIIMTNGSTDMEAIIKKLGVA
jgi:tryptophanyl-tRNA synthetase